MKSFFALGAALLELSAHSVLSAAVPAEPVSIVERDLEVVRLEQRQSCTNSASDRGCWLDGYDIDTDRYNSYPDTGVTVSYDFSITNTTCSPDGNSTRTCLLVDGQLPGPLITANWGDTLSVTIRNELEHNGTSIHWHGLRQLNSNLQDGVNGVTECALAPGDSKTYTFRATEYGTSWYHSHFSAQYGDGVLGPIVINGPATANYDIDLGTYLLQDWYYLTAYQAAARAFNNGLGGAPPTGNNILINGTNVNPQGPGGAYNNVTLTPGKTHRLRIINGALDASLRVSLDGHPFTVITNDFVPVVPYTTNYLQVGIGQRYDVIITANQTGDNFWFRADPEGNCNSVNNGAGRAIWTYENATQAEPTTEENSGVPTTCDNPDSTPHNSKDVPSDTFTSQARTLPVDFGSTVVSNNQSVIVWTVNGTSMVIDPGKPTLEYVAEGNTSYPDSYNLVQIDPDASWVYWVIQQADGAPPLYHPIHLHGHDFYVLGYGAGTFSVDDNLGDLQFTNPPRRDVTFLPASGWLVLAYPTDNPGAWLMHCHIAFHVSMGLSTQFLERQDNITLPAQGSDWYDTCTNWNAYESSGPVYAQDDSGLRKRWPPLASEY